MTLAALIVASVAGCADPESGLLTVNGTAVLAAGLGERAVLVMVFRQTGDGSFDFDHDVGLPSGTRVVVLEDAPTRPGVQPSLRLVRVRVAEGEHEGLEGKVSRRHLWP
jgi:hypothetical protein